MKSLLSIFFLTYTFQMISGQEIYISSGNNSIYRLQMADCSYDFVVQVNRQIYDISFDPNGTLYGISGNGNFFWIDILTGVTNLLHDFGGQSFNSLTFSADGTVYTIGDDGELWTFDLVTGTATYLGDIGYDATGDLTFYKGELYAAVTNDRIVRINLATPSNSAVVIDENIPGNILGIVSDVVDCTEINCYAITNGLSDIYKIDFDNQTLQLVCELNISVGGGASTTEFLGSSPIQLGSFILQEPNCKNENGSILIEAGGGFGDLEYSIDGLSFDEDSMFNNLTEGTYTIIIRDEIGCKDSSEITLTITPSPIIDTIILVPSTCGEENGSLLALASGGIGPLVYSLDSVTFQLSGFFENLSPDRFTVFVKDSAGCTVLDEGQIDSLVAASIIRTDVSNTFCDEANGMIRILADDTIGTRYSIDGFQFQTHHLFENLQAQSYVVTIEDINGCKDTLTVFIGDSELPQIDLLELHSENCGKLNGSISVMGSGGKGEYLYSIDGDSFQESHTFTNLASGIYTVHILDEDACTNLKVIELEEVAGLHILSISSLPTQCGEHTGMIILDIEGGTSPVMYSLNNGLVQSEEIFERLGAGSYSIGIIDAAGCSEDTIINLSQIGCPIYIPNVFTPNGDGNNDVFQIQTGDENEVRITRFYIFDRWGNNVYTRHDFPIHSSDGWWDGTFKRWTQNPGVYAYYIEVEFESGDREAYKGDVTLIR